ncbi:MAG TPA: hypothetical protein VFQ43_19895 [Nitrososphaera sp.]|nr:hypothetical protein [Nitrososphaera sp.]
MTKPPIKPLGKNRRRLVLLVIAIGIYTFFAPMVVIEPALLAICFAKTLDEPDPERRGDRERRLNSRSK